MALGLFEGSGEQYCRSSLPFPKFSEYWLVFVFYAVFAVDAAFFDDGVHTISETGLVASASVGHFRQQPGGKQCT